MSKKIRILLFPFIVISISFIIFYPLVCWVLFIKLQFWNVKEDLYEFWLPFALPWLPVLIWLRTRIKLLKLKREKKSPDFVYMLIAVLAVAFPTICATKFMETATGKLTILKSVDGINKHPITKYYTIEQHYISKLYSSIYYSATPVGKYNRNLRLEMHIACPVYDSSVQPYHELAFSAPDTLSTEYTVIGTISPDEQKKADSLLIANNRKGIIIIDDVLADSSQLSAIPYNTIASVNVLEAEQARKIYGKRGEKGVLIIETLKNDFNSEPPPMIDLPQAWLGVQYTETISNRLSQEETKELEDAFYKNTMQSFEHTNLESFTYLERIGNNDEREKYEKAISKAGLIKDANAIIIMEPKFDAFEDRNGNKLLWTLITFCAGAIIWFIMIIIPKWHEAKLRSYTCKQEEQRV